MKRFRTYARAGALHSLRIELLEDRRLLAFTVNHTPYLQLGNAPLSGYDSGFDQAEVLWQTTGAADTDTFTAQVRAAGSGIWNNVALNSQIVTGIETRIVHSATLPALAFNSDYEYQITHLRGGSPIATYGSSFHTRLASSAQDGFTFATYGDSASGDPPGNFIAVQNRINALNPAFSLLLGDNVYTTGTHAEYDLRLDPSKNPALTTYNKDHIDYFAFGNHDVGFNNGQAALDNYSSPIPVEGVTSPAGIVFDANVQAEKNYSYDYGNTHFLTFDTNNWTNNAAVDKQLNWAVADILAAKARAVPPKWIIVYGHHPITSLGGHTEHTPDDYYYDQVLSRLGPSGVGVDLLLFGHAHNYQRSYPLTGHSGATATYVLDADNDYAKGAGLPLVVQGTGGVGLGYGANDTTFSGKYLARALDSATSNPVEFGFGRVDVTPTQLRYRYVNTLGQTIDEFTITRVADTIAPIATLASPVDNGSLDLNATNNELLLGTTLANLQVQLSDSLSGIDDATVTAGAVTLTQNLLPMTQGVDYTFSYDTATNRITLTPAGSTFADGQYALTVGASIRDQEANPLSPTSWRVVVQSVLNSPATFRNGENGYSSAQDTYLHEDEPATTHGSNVKVYSDGDDDLGTAETPVQRVQGLIRFDHVFNTPGGVSRGGGPIPDGSTILDATLTVKTGTASGDESPGGNTFAFYRMIVTWQESTATWDSLVSGVALDAVDAATLPTWAINGPATLGAPVTINLTPDLQIWSDNPSLSTRGWVIHPLAGTNGWWFDSSDTATIANRPQLSVKFLPPNTAPAVSAGGAYAIVEGDSLALSAALTSDPDGDVLSYSWDINGDGTFGDALGVAPTLNWAQLAAIGLGNGPANVANLRVRVDDGRGHVVDSANTSLAIANAVPVAGFTGSGGYRGELRSFLLSGADAGPADQAALSYQLDWDGNGSVDETIVAPAGSMSASHAFTASGSVTARLTVVDQDGTPSAPVDLPITTSDFVLRDNGSGAIDLLWGGTPGIDSAFFYSAFGGTVAVFVPIENSLATSKISRVSGVTGKVVAYGYDSPDLIAGEWLMSRAAEFYGGNGDDVLVGGFAGDLLDGGQGADLLVGGTQFIDGADTLLGGGGSDLLVGHRGADMLDGGPGEDLLVADRIAFSDYASALLAIYDEWRSPRGYADRVANILGTGIGPRANGSFFLQPGVTVFDDGAVDSLLGGAQLDWLIYRAVQDLLGDDEPGEIKTAT